jgi:hypothetical protein
MNSMFTLVGILYLAHLVACGWFYVGNKQGVGSVDGEVCVRCTVHRILLLLESQSPWLYREQAGFIRGSAVII